MFCTKNREGFRLALFSLVCISASAGASVAQAGCKYVVTNDWGSGFTAAIEITNDGANAINSWQVSWQYTDGSVRTAGWNSNVTGTNPYSATPLSWNAMISPGATVSFGVQGNNGGSSAQVVTVTGDVCGEGSAPDDDAPPVDDDDDDTPPVDDDDDDDTPPVDDDDDDYTPPVDDDDDDAPPMDDGIDGMLKGVSVAGADFGYTALPGIYDEDYTYPTQTEVDYFKSKGMNVLRLPFRWERLQRGLNQPFNATEFGRLNTFVTEATAKGMYILLDPHNYARYNGNLIGSGAVPHSAFADFWGRLAETYKGNARVIFGLMNEPHTMPTEQWISAANAAAAAIRQAGANNLIMVSGNAWTGAHSWFQNWYGTANATAILNFVDPGNNYVVELHQYFDSDYSGTAAPCTVTDASQVLASVTAWLRTNNLRGFLGEFAGADNSACRAAIQSALQHMDTNSQQWLGWTWWAAGPWWTWQDYMYSLQPAIDGSEAPQIPWLAPYLP